MGDLSKTIANASELLNKLAGPAFEECGAMVGDTLHVYRVKNLLRTVDKTKRILLEAGVSPNAVPSRLLLPLLENCSLEDDDDLQERWARLLASASQETQEMSPSYIETLKQLTPSEAKHLDHVYEDAAKREAPKVPTKHTFVTPYAFTDAWKSPNGAGDTFERLGLVHRDYRVKVLTPARIIASENETIEMSLDSIESAILSLEADVQHTFMFTEYGIGFLRACRGPQKRA